MATQWPPVSLATSAALLLTGGFQVEVTDFPATGLGFDDLVKTLEKTRPAVAAWSTATPTIESDLSIGPLVKSVSPQTLTAVLGTHVTAHPEMALDHPGIDTVIRKEPERIIYNLCAGLKEGRDNIPGISYRDAAGAVVHNPDQPFMPPEEIPFPAWHLLDLAPYRLPLKGSPFLIVAPIRGCPFPCSFCTARIYYGKRLRKRPAAQVAEEIARNRALHGVEDFFIWADTFTADRRYVIEFCRELLKKNLNISWTCNSRVDTIDREMLLLMKRAGLWMISFGIESADADILKKCGKGISADQSRRAVALAHEAGVRTSGHFMFGLPGETAASMRRTLDFALELPLDVAQFYATAPFPGTRLHREALEKGWIKRTASSQNQAAMELPGLSAEAVDRFRQYAYRRFYMRPKTWRNLLGMLEPAAVLHLVKSTARFTRWARSAD